MNTLETNNLLISFKLFSFEYHVAYCIDIRYLFLKLMQITLHPRTSS